MSNMLYSQESQFCLSGESFNRHNGTDIITVDLCKMILLKNDNMSSRIRTTFLNRGIQLWCLAASMLFNENQNLSNSFACITTTALWQVSVVFK